MAGGMAWGCHNEPTPLPDGGGGGLFRRLGALAGPRVASIPLCASVRPPRRPLRPCSLYLLAMSPTQADLEMGFATRGAQIVACDAARRLAARTLEAEHELQDRLRTTTR